MAILRATIALAKPVGGVRLAASTSKDMRGAIYGIPIAAEAVTDTKNGSKSYGALAQLTVDGLLAGTLYYLAIEVSGQLQAYPRGQARTAMSGAQSFSFGFGSCEDSGSNHVVFDAMRTMATDSAWQFFGHIGDKGYPDLSTSDPSLYLRNLSEQIRRPRQAAFHRSLRLPYVPDDHDNDKQGSLLVNDDVTRPTLRALWTALGRRNPIKLAADTSNGMYHSWQEGRVLFIMTDLRSMRNLESKPDGPDKTMMGSVQKAWFKQRLDFAASQKLAVMWFSSTPWYGGATDDWAAYATERREIADYVKAAGLVGRFAILTGDYHVMGIDDGTHTDFATGGGCPIPQFVSSGMDRIRTTTITLPFSHGESFNYRGQFGAVEITDTGGASIGVAFKAYRTTSATDPTPIQTLTYSWTATGLA